MASLQSLRPAPAAPVRRVLIVEDNAITTDLLRVVLEERGYEVDVALDGEAALGALLAATYDVVVIDFHLPKMNGRDVVARYRAGGASGRATRFIAITSDVKGLLANPTDCAHFDTLVPKPLDVDRLCRVIEGASRGAAGAPVPSAAGAHIPSAAGAHIPSAAGAHIPSAAGAHIPGAEGTEPPAAATPPAGALEHAPPSHAALLQMAPSQPAPTQPAHSQALNLLRWPADFAGDRLSPRALQASIGDASFDALMIDEAPTAADLAAIGRAGALHVLPVIDLTGTLGRRADLCVHRDSGPDARRIAALVEAFHARRALVCPRLLHGTDAADRLLARIFIADRGLSAFHSGGAREVVIHDTLLDPRMAREAAAALAARGLLKATFFDRVHLCARCGSSRFNAREVCADCLSADLVEEPYLHHFACAAHGPEREFRDGAADAGLVCPSCRQPLGEAGVDYDAPGSVLGCHGCGQTGGDQVLERLCLDCEARWGDGDLACLNISSYELTDEGRAFAQSGDTMTGTAGTLLKFGELPVALVVALHGAIERFRETGETFTLAEIAYGREREVIHEAGPRAFSAARARFIETFTMCLGARGRVVRAHTYDFALIAGMPQAQARSCLEELRVQATAGLRYDIGIAMRLQDASHFV